MKKKTTNIQKKELPFIIIGGRKHPRKGIHRTAIMDYDYLHWYFWKNHDKMPTHYFEKFVEIIFKLNNFIPKRRCTMCKKQAFYLSIEIYNDRLPKFIRGSLVDEERNPISNGEKGIEKYTILEGQGREIERWDVRSSIPYCEIHAPEQERNSRTYPIGFDIILDMPYFPKSQKENMHHHLLRLAGFKGRRTENNARTFIENLRTRIEIPPLEELLHQISLHPKRQRQEEKRLQKRFLF